MRRRAGLGNDREFLHMLTMDTGRVKKDMEDTKRTSTCQRQEGT